MPLLISSVLTAWLVLSVLNQFRRPGSRWGRCYSRALRRFDGCYLVPDYRYFAPSPPAHDFELLYRDRLDDGTTSPWRWLPAAGPRRLLWNPGTRVSHALAAVCASLLESARAAAAGNAAPEDLYVSFAYVALACRVARAPHGVASTESQFIVAVSAGFDTQRAPAIAFLSPFFRL